MVPARAMVYNSHPIILVLVLRMAVMCLGSDFSVESNNLQLQLQSTRLSGNSAKRKTKSFTTLKFCRVYSRHMPSTT